MQGHLGSKRQGWDRAVTPEPLCLGVGGDQRRGEGIITRFVDGVGGKGGS